MTHDDRLPRLPGEHHSGSAQPADRDHARPDEAGTAPTGARVPSDDVGTAPRGGTSEAGTAPRGGTSEAGTAPRAGTSEAGTVPRTGASEAGAVPRVSATEAGTIPRGSASETGTVPRTGASGVESRGSRRARISGLLGRTRPPGQSSSSATAARSAQLIARRAVTKIIEDPAPTTQPIPIVAVLRNTPYSAPVQEAAKSEGEAHMILDLAVDLGQMMLRAGASTQDVEASVIATCTSYGLDTAEVDLTANSLTVHYSDPAGNDFTAMRVSREESVHFAKLSAIHALVTEMVDGRIDVERARERLDAIRRQKRPYPEWLVDVAWGALVASFVNLVGGSLVSSLLGFFIAIANQRFGALLGRTGMPYFYIVIIQAMSITVLSMGAASLDLIASPQFLVASGIVLLLPTMGLITAVQDAITDFPLTASGQAISVALTFAAIVVGIAAGLMIGQMLNLRTIEVTLPSTGTQFLTTLVSLVAALIVAAGGAVGMQATKRFILPAALVGLVGFGIMVLCLVGGLNGILTSFLASTVVGILARPIALRLGAPALVLVIPGLYPLLSGLSIFNAAYLIVQPEESVGLATGLSSLFTAITVNAALGAGAVLGTFLATWMPYGQGRRERAAKRAEAKEAEAKEAEAEAGTATGTSGAVDSEGAQESGRGAD